LQSLYDMFVAVCSNLACSDKPALLFFIDLV